MPEGGERDPSRVQKLVAHLLGNRPNEYAVGRAGDEVANVFLTGQRGHGFAVSGAGVMGGEGPVHAAAFGAFQVCVVGALPGGAATPDGGAGLLVAGVERRERNSRDQGESRGGFCGHGVLSVDSGQ